MKDNIYKGFTFFYVLDLYSPKVPKSESKQETQVYYFWVECSQNHIHVNKVELEMATRQYNLWPIIIKISNFLQFYKFF